jgi:hypothetical protein
MPERAEMDFEMAARNIVEARRVVEAQRRRIAKLNERGRPTFKEEQMLRVLKSTLRIFEDEERKLRRDEERKLRRGGADEPAEVSRGK